MGDNYHVLILWIIGNKKDNVTVIYTPWSNLKKDGSMAVGQVGFKDQKKVHRSHFLLLASSYACLLNILLNIHAIRQRANYSS
jgi:hypothetical protein